MVAAPRIATGPGPDPLMQEAIQRGGGQPVATGEPADGLVWLDGWDVAGLRAVLRAVPGIRWVQLPFAGVENFTGQDLFADGRVWTCAKGAYAEAVAEHALTLALTGLRRIHDRVRADDWGPQGGASLYDQPVTILGGGGVAQALAGLLAPFRARVTVVRRQARPVPGTERVVTGGALHDVLPGTLVVFVVTPPTPRACSCRDWPTASPPTSPASPQANHSTAGSTRPQATEAGSPPRRTRRATAQEASQPRNEMPT